MASLSVPARVLVLPLTLADRLRLYWLRALGPLAKPLVRRRELRVAVAGSTLLLLALAATLLVPLWLLALGPIVWGIPHALSDVRYLWVRPGHHRRVSLWVLIGVPLLALSITAAPSWGFAACAGALLAARGSLVRRLLGLAIVVPLVFASYVEALVATAIFAHVHNVVGIVLWWRWRERKSLLHLIPLAVILVASVLLLAGVFDPIVLAAAGLDASPGGMHVYYHLETLVPGIHGPLGVRMLLLFAFAQAAHYVVWIRLVPEEDRPRETPRTFAASVRALRADFGWPLLALTLLAMIVLAAWACLDLFAARAGYLRAALFHGHLELAAAALLIVEGVRPHTSTERAA